MRNLALYMPAFAWAGAMYVCMRMMGRGHRITQTPDATHDVDGLKAQVSRLRAELNEVKRNERVDG